MSVEVVAWSPDWAEQFEGVADTLRAAVAGIPGARVEHVGSTSVPGLAAKPVLDIDVIVAREHVPTAVAALERVGYAHRGDLGVVDREAFHAPDAAPRRHVYVCVAGTTHVRNHLAVRDVLRRRDDLREAYADVKRRLADDPAMDVDAYLAGKSAVLHEVLRASGELTDAELLEIHRLNDPSA